MRVDVLTIFPEYLAPLDLSLVGKARSAGILDVRVHDLRDWTTDRHRTVDDTPFGGGAGMVMRPDVWGSALDDVLGLDRVVDGATPSEDPLAAPARLLIPTPSGTPLDQRTAEALARESHLVIACGRYEGIDARVAEHYRQVAVEHGGVTVSEFSLGDYVLNGGEVAALVLIEAVARLLPGVVGNPRSLDEESHGSSGLLEYGVYTKPPTWRGLDVPEVLLSGHHARIERWRRDEALRRTAERRPEILERADPGAFDPLDRNLLGSWGWSTGPDGPRRPGVVDQGSSAD
ncbi:tRNA (guanine-N(1)-)-methyltransferase [mine drainage metagenome]|uniref:tRNA (guanine-N(1)-)-methyltransferase n=1 Tax=mine drainage metagenome TaxID=410659 RepID=A0A1J5QG42_9ZZZZ